MVSEGRGRLFRRKDGKYLIYLPGGGQHLPLERFRQHTGEGQLPAGWRTEAVDRRVGTGRRITRIHCLILGR